MAKRLTEDDKIRINELYLKIGTYSGVAKETGFAPTTVKKYIIKDFKPVIEVEKKTFKTEDIPEEIDYSSFIEAENLGELCELSEEEVKELEELWTELVL